MSVFWLEACDNAGATAVIDCPAAFEAFVKSTAEDYRVSIMLGDQKLAEITSYADDVDALIEDVVHAELPGGPIPGMPAGYRHAEILRQTYTQGDCDVFAVALQKIIGGELYAVTDPRDERGRPVRLHYLVHAGVYDGEHVFDIDGKTQADEWSSTWRENGSCVFDGYTDLITKDRLQRLQKTKHTPEVIARATQVAWMIAALTGALNDAQLAQYQARCAPALKLAA